MIGKIPSIQFYLGNGVYKLLTLSQKSLSRLQL
jgi:hypothetical protein